MIAPGSSDLGLSVVSRTRSALAAASPMSGRLVASRSPPHPNTTIRRPWPTSRRVSITWASPSGVWA